ncbi:MAG: thymidylate synthase [Candidatus Hodarchaeales archaeon]|jgi:thymidylate synthase
MYIIEVESIVDGWERLKNYIIKEGSIAYDGAESLTEILDLYLIVKKPEKSAEESPIINPEMKNWMMSNFKEIKTVPELHNAKSYGWRLYNNNGNRINWVIDKLRNNIWTKSATVSLILPDDKKYIPCVSLLDFKIRENTLLLSVTCRSLDVGKKALYNFYALSDIAHEIATTINVKDINLKILILSAHVYQKDQ